MSRFRNVGTSITIIWILAIVGFGSTIVFLVFSDLDLGGEWTGRAQIGAAISSAFALILSIMAVVVTVRISSSDYKVEQDVRVHITQLLATGNSIFVKATHLTQKRSPGLTSFDFRKEQEVINAFISSTTAYAFASWIHLKKSPKSGSNPEEWRAFFLYLADLLDTDEGDFVTLATRTKKMLNLLTELTEADIRDISNEVINLSASVPRFKKALEADPIWLAWGSIAGGSKSKNVDLEPQIPIEMLRGLKDSGIEDPDLDLWLGFESNNMEMIRTAQANGADPSLKAIDLISRHRVILAERFPELLRQFDEGMTKKSNGSEI